MPYLLSWDFWGTNKLHIHSNSSPQNFPAGLFDSNPKVIYWSAFVGQCGMFKQNHFSLWSYARVGKKRYLSSTVFRTHVITFKAVPEKKPLCLKRSKISLRFKRWHKFEGISWVKLYFEHLKRVSSSRSISCFSSLKSWLVSRTNCAMNALTMQTEKLYMGTKVWLLLKLSMRAPNNLPSLTFFSF